MNIQAGNRIFAGSLSPFSNSGLKSTDQKLERQKTCENQIAFWENQKEKLKSMKSDNLEDIERKLELFHSYKDQIAAAKAQYNNEQMFCILDEAMERAEKIAEEAEKWKPKTPEERKEELLEEALGAEEEEGVLEDVMGEMRQMREELSEQLVEDIEEEMEESLKEATEQIPDEAGIALEQEDMADIIRAEIESRQRYDGIDIRV